MMQHREQIERLMGAALAAADPYHATRKAVRRAGPLVQVGGHSFDVRRGRVFLVATGKAAVPMAHAAVHILGDALHAGVVITKQGYPVQAIAEAGSPLRLFAAGHPLANELSVAGTAAVQELLAQTTAADLVLCLISGGSSALLTQPRLPLADWQALNASLLASGCTIHELNSVRKQLDSIKGGGLARAAAPATCLSLILSDVVGNPLESIGSGPTVPNPEPPHVARAILERYGLLTADVAALLAGQTAAPLPPTPRATLVVGDVSTAVHAAAEEARGWGWHTHVLTWHLEGEAREVGKVTAALAKSAAPQTCLILGGETTVTMGTAAGQGGRNTELALAAAIALAGQRGATIASFATDGDDGSSGAAGALVTGQTAVLARQHGLNPLDYLARHDSGSFFAHLDQHSPIPHLLQTGPTGTNVNDLIFILRA